MKKKRLHGPYSQIDFHSGLSPISTGLGQSPFFVIKTIFSPHQYSSIKPIYPATASLPGTNIPPGSPEYQTYIPPPGYNQ